MKKQLALGAFLLLTPFTAATSQELTYPTLSSVEIRAGATYDNNEQLFHYVYELKNGALNTGKISGFEIDISRTPETAELDTAGLRFVKDGFTEGSFRRNFPSLKGKVVPVGFLVTPGGTWIGGLTQRFTADFVGTRSYGLPPGTHSSAFELISKGLPAIRAFTVSPFFDFDSLFSKERFPNDEDVPNTDSIREAGKNNGWTVGPTAPPLLFIEGDWLDTLGSYAIRARLLNWIKDQSTADKYRNYFATAKTRLMQYDTVSARAALRQVLLAVDIDSATAVTSEAYALIRFNTEYLLARLPASPMPGLVAKLINSTGTRLTTGSLQYYDGTWKDATNNSDGTFTVTTSLKTISLRMTYEGGSQQKNNVPVGPDTVVFQTVNTQIKLQNSQGALIDTGVVQYYAGSWRAFGLTSSGVATKELLPGSYSFRMTYAYGSNDKQQDIGANPIVVFSTTNVSVQLKNSQGAFIDQGSVQFYAGAWRIFGTTSNGTVSRELLPDSYSFRMTYAYGSNDKQQNIGTDPTVVFSTVNTTLELRNSQGSLIDQGTAQYFAGAWRDFGATSGGVVSKELLPANYSFRMTYAYGSNDKQQNIGTNPTVVFNTVNATVELRNSQGVLTDGGTVQYYSGAWRSFGTTNGGSVSKELLPANYTFRMAHEYVSVDKAQNISTNSTVGFSTVLCTIRVRNAQNEAVNGALASYYSGAWRQIGQTANGEITKELLPANMTFRISYGGTTQDKAQNLGTNAVVEFVVQ